MRKKKSLNFGGKSYKYMSDASIGGMTVKELKSYIRNMTERVSKGITSGKKAISTHAMSIIKDFGTYRRNNKTFVRLGFSKARKADLLSKASQLQAYAKSYDLINDRSFKFEKADREKAYQSFILTKNGKYKNTTRKEYDTMFRVFDNLGTIFEEFGSTVINMYYQFRSSVDAETFGDLIIETMNEELGKNFEDETEEMDELEKLETEYAAYEIVLQKVYEKLKTGRF